MLYQDLHRIPEALDVLHKALDVARAAGEWRRLRKLLLRLADTERFRHSTATARAYANEVVLMDDDGSYKPLAYQTLAAVARTEGNGPAMRRYFEEALRSRPDPNIFIATNLSDIGRLDPQPGDLPRLQGWLNTLRASGRLSPAELAYVDDLEGRLLILRDRAAGAAVLERAIAAADAIPREIVAAKGRDEAYMALIADAARQGDHARVLGLIARDLRLPAPDACALGMIAEDEYSAVVARGSDGTYHADYDLQRSARPGAPTNSDAPRVSEELTSSLAGCAQVRVLAHAALQGQPRVLPATLAWSYATGARRDLAQGGAPGRTQALVVTDVIPPTDLKLSTLSAGAAETSSSIHKLLGAAATPASVLEAMRDASEIQFHTHALVNMGVSDASYLILSPGSDGRYALTAEAIRGADLRARPIIVLAACHSAQGARYKHAPWSLPHAFLSIGARAVFAAGSDIPDAAAGPFFTRVLARIRDGATPAVALRDERMAALASDDASWVADVIVFE
jgi:hypothetical protein